jgi:hypothetical protein
VVDNPRAGGGDSASEAKCAANLDGGGGGRGEEVRSPVEEAMQVEEERCCRALSSGAGSGSPSLTRLGHDTIGTWCSVGNNRLKFTRSTVFA